MSTRITNHHLEAVAARINRMTNSPAVAWEQDAEGRFRANVGNFHISYCYGGVCLHRMDNESGGVTTPLGSGHFTKRELYGRMHAFIAGLSFNSTN